MFSDWFKQQIRKTIQTQPFFLTTQYQVTAKISSVSKIKN